MTNFKATKLALVIALLSGGAVSSNAYAADSDNENLVNVKTDADSYNASADKSTVAPNATAADEATYSSASADQAESEMEEARSGDVTAPNAYGATDSVPNDEFLSEEAATVTSRESDISDDSASKSMSSDAASDSDMNRSEYRTSDATSTSAKAAGENPNQVHFEFDSAELTEEAQSSLDLLAKELKDEERPITISISGYTDATGPEEYNKDLAQRRAKAVQEYFKDQEIEVSAWEVNAPGEEEPVASNENLEGRQENRRVEINFTSEDGEVSVVSD